MSLPLSVPRRATPPANLADPARVHAEIAFSVRKRAFDIMSSGALLILVAPVMALIAVIIKASSRGPVFFRQQRVGLGGRPFVMLKFRSMRADASDQRHRAHIATMVRSNASVTKTGTTYKLVGDDRVTPVGRFLRRTSLDELPQLWNVLRGDMSMVGPRPPIDYEVDMYEPWQFERLSVRPGLTGHWQVSARSSVSYVDMCRMDVEYVRNWRFAWDIRIAVKTPAVMFLNSGEKA